MALGFPASYCAGRYGKSDLTVEKKRRALSEGAERRELLTDYSALVGGSGMGWGENPSDFDGFCWVKWGMIIVVCCNHRKLVANWNTQLNWINWCWREIEAKLGTQFSPQSDEITSGHWHQQMQPAMMTTKAWGVEKCHQKWRYNGGLQDLKGIYRDMIGIYWVIVLKTPVAWYGILLSNTLVIFKVIVKIPIIIT